MFFKNPKQLPADKVSCKWVRSDSASVQNGLFAENFIGCSCHIGNLIEKDNLKKFSEALKERKGYNGNKNKLLEQMWSLDMNDSKWFKQIKGKM